MIYFAYRANPAIPGTWVVERGSIAIGSVNRRFFEPFHNITLTLEELRGLATFIEQNQGGR